MRTGDMTRPIGSRTICGMSNYPSSFADLDVVRALWLLGFAE
jgi:hypothetical protein